MRAVRDLRDLVNVSRLSYVDSDDENNYSASSMYSFNSSLDFEQSHFFDTRRSKSKLIDSVPSLNKSNTQPKSRNSPLFSSTTPIDSLLHNRSSHSINELSSSSGFNKSEARSSFFKDKSLLLDRNSRPNLMISLNTKKPLPPLKQFVSHDLQIIEQEPVKSKKSKDYEESIKPLSMKKNSTESSEAEATSKETKSGNFDQMLTYIDASVVSEWLNRANRSLRKMHRWHQDNSSLFDTAQSKTFLKYEPFVCFANFWLGCNSSSKLDHKQRRQLFEMEYSIICDEVTQAFQVGIDSQTIGLADVHRLLHAVFKEYPLQLLSFRGVYLLLDYIDILSSNRLDEYRKLLSDVKCRTVNKQYAQWLLSIRSFSLINLCWSIVKFYRNTCEKELLSNQNELNDNPKADGLLSDLNGRLTSLSVVSKYEELSSAGSTSSLSSNSTKSNSKTKRAKSGKSTFLNRTAEAEFFQISNQEKYDCYLKAVLK